VLKSQWRRQLWGTGAHIPSTSNELFFSVNFRAAQSLTATFVRSPLQICLYPASAPAVVQSQLHELNLIRCIILCCFCMGHIISMYFGATILASDPGSATVKTMCVGECICHS